MTYQTCPGDTSDLGEQLTQVLGRWLHDHGYPVLVDEAGCLADIALRIVEPYFAVDELGKLASAITGMKLEPGKEWELTRLAHLAAADLRAVAEAARPQGDPTLAAVHKLVTGVEITPEQAQEWVQRRAPRVWRRGDPEPEDRPVVRGREGSVLFFTHNGFPKQSPEWWCLDAGPNSGGWNTWNNWLARIGPLTEILVDSASAEGGDPGGGQP